jgi:ubiquinol-cytochrome c reductase cytochrome c subunit
MRTISAALAAALLLAPAAHAADASKGKAAFLKHGCFQCHGTQGQGAVTGKRLAPDPIPEETFIGFVRSTNGPMPPYRAAILSDGDLGDIYAYLQSIPKPPDPKTIPLLSP